LCGAIATSWFLDNVDLVFSLNYARFWSRWVAIVDLGTLVAFDRSDAKPVMLAKVLLAWKSSLPVGPRQERMLSAQPSEAIAISKVRF
jgi:hypothetical protein